MNADGADRAEQRELARRLAGDDADRVLVEARAAVARVVSERLFRELVAELAAELLRHRELDAAQNSQIHERVHHGQSS